MRSLRGLRLSFVQGLVTGLEGCRVVADKGYDSRAMRGAVERSGSRSCIPLRKGNTAKSDFHKGW